jgi:hypothetical protein
LVLPESKNETSDCKNNMDVNEKWKDVRDNNMSEKRGINQDINYNFIENMQFYEVSIY